MLGVFVSQHNYSNLAIATFTATKPKATTSCKGAAVSLQGFLNGIFFTSVTVNASGSGKIRLQVSQDGTNYANYGILTNDMTTTHNLVSTPINGIGLKYVRAVVCPSTTTTHVTAVVKVMAYA